MVLVPAVSQPVTQVTNHFWAFASLLDSGELKPAPSALEVLCLSVRVALCPLCVELACRVNSSVRAASLCWPPSRLAVISPCE